MVYGYILGFQFSDLNEYYVNAMNNSSKKNFNPKILIFAPVFAPLANPEAFSNSKLALAFLEEGWEVDIISRNLVGNIDYDYGSAWEEPWKALKKHTIELDYPLGNKIIRWSETIWAGLKMEHPIGGCRWAMHAYNQAMQLHVDRRYDVVISRALPDSAHLAAMVFAKKTGVPWVANWNDPTSKKMPPPYGLGSHADLGWAYNRLFKSVVHKADWITFPSERQRKYICQYLGNSCERKSSVIPHVIFDRQNIEEVTSDKFIVCYAGNITEERNPSSFLQGFELFIQSIAEPKTAEFVLIGFDRTACIEAAKLSSIGENINNIGTMQYKECQAYLSNKSSVLLIIEAVMEEGIFLPVKFTDYVQSGKPILAITPEKSSISDYIEEFGGGLAVNHSPVNIAKALSCMYKHWQNKNLNDTFNSSLMRKEFMPDIIINHYKNIFRYL